MFAKKYRLSKKNDFQLIFARGQRGINRFFAVRYIKNNLKNSRFAVVASNKVSKRANKRNYIKRQTREIIRINLAKFRDSYDVIVSILPSALGQKYQHLETDLLAMFKKYKLL